MLKPFRLHLLCQDAAACFEALNLQDERLATPALPEVDPLMANRILRFLSSVVLACGIAAVCTVGLAWFWKLIGGGELTIHGWIAMALGILGSVALSWALMGLAFRSNREGWDDQVDNSLDPGRQSQDRKDDDLIY